MTQRNKSRFFIWASSLLTILYVFVFVGFGIIHSIEHIEFYHHVCSKTLEKDQCHNVIYHGEKPGPNGHKWHLIPTDHCKFCDIFLRGIPTQSHFLSVKNFISTGHKLYIHAPVLHFYIISFRHNSRAPPALVA